MYSSFIPDSIWHFISRSLLISFLRCLQNESNLSRLEERREVRGQLTMPYIRYKQLIQHLLREVEHTVVDHREALKAPSPQSRSGRCEVRLECRLRFQQLCTKHILVWEELLIRDGSTYQMI